MAKTTYRTRGYPLAKKAVLAEGAWFPPTGPLARDEKRIQGLFQANECEGRFWFLLARVLLAKFREKEVK